MEPCVCEDDRGRGLVWRGDKNPDVHSECRRKAFAGTDADTQKDAVERACQSSMFTASIVLVKCETRLLAKSKDRGGSVEKRVYEIVIWENGRVNATGTCSMSGLWRSLVLNGK